jgi:hypothetical protein
MFGSTIDDDNWAIDEKNELILWKVSFSWIKILNDMACNLNWIQIPKFNLNILIQFNY